MPPRRVRARPKGFLRITPGLHDIGLSRAHITRACEASPCRLRTDYLDLYICHQPDCFVAVAETMRAFDDVVTQGKVRYVGCSNHFAWQVMKALAVSEKHNLPRSKYGMAIPGIVAALSPDHLGTRERVHPSEAGAASKVRVDPTRLQRAEVYGVEGMANAARPIDGRRGRTERFEAMVVVHQLVVGVIA